MNDTTATPTATETLLEGRSALRDEDVSMTFTNGLTGESVTLDRAARERFTRHLDESVKLAIPQEASFGDDEFMVSEALERRAGVLRRRHPGLFGHLDHLEVTYLWKKSGGTSKGRATFGKTVKPSGLLKHFSEATFVIWLAADHCRDARYGDREIEALLFHEMCHTGMTEVDEDDDEQVPQPTLVPHDVELFRAEVDAYGLWNLDLRTVAPAFRQLRLEEARVDD